RPPALWRRIRRGRAPGSALRALREARPLAQKRANRLRQLSAVLDPLVERRLVDSHLAGGRLVRPQRLEEASIPPAPRIRGDDAVVGSLLGTGPGQTNVNRHSRFLTSGASRNAMPLGSRPSYPPEGPLSRQAAGDRAEKNLQVPVREAQPGPDEEVAAHAKAARDRVPPRPGEGVVEPDGQVEVRNDREVGVGANAGEARLGPRKVEGVQREGEAVVEE